MFQIKKKRERKINDYETNMNSLRNAPQLKGDSVKKDAPASCRYTTEVSTQKQRI